ncbi:MAG: hypothetical protein LBV08_10470 [Clostridiales bacterium]|jgi:hypothetical protein|nr:hypothetical protein [Clostridiales bacterium]
MKSNRVKNIVIFLLVILLIYQTVRLWFMDISNHNLFSTFLPNTLELSNVNIEQPFHCPYRVIYNPGSGEFKITYQGIKDKIKLYGFYDILKSPQALSFEESGPIDLSNALERRSFIYQYNFTMDTGLFLSSFGKTKRNELSRFDSFDTIIISPDREIINTVTIYFIDSENNMSYKYSSVIKNSLYEQVNSYLDEGNDFSGMLYESSALKKWPIFSENVFYPKWGESGFEYSPLEISNPYFNSNGKEDFVNIRQQTYVFFDNPVINNSSPFPDTGETQGFLYSDNGQKAVRYYLQNKHMLEYTNFGDFSSYKKTTVCEDYNSAIRFVENDPYIINDFYLSSYAPEDNQTVFYFDYAINDFKIEVSNQMDIAHHIEVTVENGMVVSYKKLVLNYSGLKPLGSITTTCEELVMDLQKNEQEGLVIENIELVYIATAKNGQEAFDNLYLNWGVKPFGKNVTITRPA